MPLPDPDFTSQIELNALGEPTLQSLGLGGYGPSGLFQQALEFLHVNLDCPWWGAIVIGKCLYSELNGQGLKDFLQACL